MMTLGPGPAATVDDLLNDGARGEVFVTRMMSTVKVWQSRKMVDLSSKLWQTPGSNSISSSKRKVRSAHNAGAPPSVGLMMGPINGNWKSAQDRANRGVMQSLVKRELEECARSGQSGRYAVTCPQHVSAHAGPKAAPKIVQAASITGSGGISLVRSADR